MSLNNQSVRLAGLGRREEALAAIEGAVDTYWQLAEARPHAFLPDLATSLNNQSVRLAGLGRREEALAAIEQAVEIRRQLAEARPDAFLPDLATSLNNQSNRLADLARREEALAAIEEALRLILPLLERAPYVLPDAGEHLVRGYIQLCDESQKEPEQQLLQRAHAVLVRAGVVPPGDD